MKSRRDFLKLVAAGSAAASLGRAGRAAAATTAKSGKSAKPAAHATRSAAVETEIAKEKKSTDDTLKTIRKHELPTGSALAFTFKPMKARKGGK